MLVSAFDVYITTSARILHFASTVCSVYHSEMNNLGSRLHVFQQYRMFCLFSCRYKPLWLYFHSPVTDFSFLVFEVS
jgi:hypothetical protein